MTALKVRIAPGTWVGVSTLAAASRAVREYLDGNNLGFRAWGLESADVRDAANRTIARVSFNGRVWTGQRDWQQRTEIRGAALDVEGGPR
ncbi:MAG: hypothetical protein KDB73_20070 [Planctomycetes bacterium]|nr:hypothetical protein [Planctomycetota bacterium]